MSALSRASIIALIGMLTASFFLSNLNADQLWVLLALGPVLYGLAERQPRQNGLPVFSRTTRQKSFAHARGVQRRAFAGPVLDDRRDEALDPLLVLVVGIGIEGARQPQRRGGRVSRCRTGPRGNRGR